MALVQALGFRHEQTSASTIWTVTHNLGTEAPVVDVWVDISGTITKILPVSVVATNAQTVTITFSTSRTGVAFVA